jgi:hypothetical protein
LISLSPQYCQDHVIILPDSQQANSKPITGSAPANLTLLKNDPYKAIKNDDARYALILTRNKTLVPSDHIRVWFFTDIEPKKWAAFCKKRDVLFERIKQDIRQLKKPVQPVKQT